MSEKQLLLGDLCARLPYGLTFQSYHSECGIEGKGTFDFKIGDDATLSKLKFLCETDNNKPYLRPMSSMTEEEKDEYDSMFSNARRIHCNCVYYDTVQEDDIPDFIDWLIEHHFDYRGLIEKGLALEAPEGMYETK